MKGSETRDEKLLRQKRDLILKTLLTEDLNSDDEEKENLGIEEVRKTKMLNLNYQTNSSYQ